MKQRYFLMLIGSCLVGVLVLVAFVAVDRSSTSGSSEEAAGNTRTNQAVVGNDYPRWPAKSLTDVVGFADQVSVITVLSEKQMSKAPSVVATGEGYVGRKVVLQIDETIWRRPGAPAAHEREEIRVSGWAAHEHKLFPFIIAGTTRLDVGDRLLVALAKAPEGEWALLSEEIAYPLNGDAVVPEGSRPDAVPLGAIETNMTVRDVASLLHGAKPSPVAAKYQHLGIDARTEKVWESLLAGGSG